MLLLLLAALAGFPTAAGAGWTDLRAVPVIRMNAGEARTAVRRGESIVCRRNLQLIGLAASIYAADYNDRLPQTWIDFAPQSGQLAPTNLYCPSDLERPARTRWAEVDFAALGYTLEGPVRPPAVPVVLARCRVHDHTVLTDGSVRDARPYDPRLGPLLAEGRLVWASTTQGAVAESGFRLACRANLHQLAKAARLIASDQGDTLPSSLSELVSVLGSPRVLFCPAETWNPAPVRFEDLNIADASYTLDAPGQPQEPTKRLFTCRLHGNEADSAGVLTLGTDWYPSTLIDGHPVSLTVRPDATATFTVLPGAAATGPVRFQWRRLQPFDPQGNPSPQAAELPGETNRVFSIPTVTADDEGYYDVVVTDDHGRSQLSRIAILHIADPATITSVPGWKEGVCLNQLRLIAQAAAMHHAAWGRMPDNLAEMRSFLGWPMVLFCPSDAERTAPDSWAGLDPLTTSYAFIPSVPADSTNILATCRVHGFQIDNHARLVDVPGSPLRPRLTLLPATDRQSVVLSATGLPGAFCVIQVSTDLVNWRNVGFDQLTAAPFLVTNRIAFDEPERFFRAQTP